MKVYRLTEDQLEKLQATLESFDDILRTYDNVVENILYRRGSIDTERCEISEAQDLLTTAQALLGNLQTVSPLEALAEQAE